MVYAELGPRKQPKQEASPVQPMLGSVIMKSALYSSGSSQAKDLNHAIGYRIAKDAVPLKARIHGATLSHATCRL